MFPLCFSVMDSVYSMWLCGKDRDGGRVDKQFQLRFTEAVTQRVIEVSYKANFAGFVRCIK